MKLDKKRKRIIGIIAAIIIIYLGVSFIRACDRVDKFNILTEKENTTLMEKIACKVKGYKLYTHEELVKNGYINDDKNKKSSSNTTETAKVDKEKEEMKILKFGEVGTTDKWQIKVLETTEPTTIEANSKYDQAISTQEKFVVVKLEVKNISTSAESCGSNTFGLSAPKAVYQIDDVGFKVLEKLNSKETIYNKNTNFVGIYDKINPGMTKNTYVAFNVPKDLDISSCALGVAYNKNKAIYMKVK